MKVIELLNKIANGEIEANEKFCYKGEEYRHIDNLFGDYYVEEVLNNDVEVIEEDKKIEKMNEFIHCDSLDYRTCNRMFEEITEKVNEIIDKVNEGE